LAIPWNIYFHAPKKSPLASPPSLSPSHRNLCSLKGFFAYCHTLYPDSPVNHSTCSVIGSSCASGFVRPGVSSHWGMMLVGRSSLVCLLLLHSQKMNAATKPYIIFCLHLYVTILTMHPGQDRCSCFLAYSGPRHGFYRYHSMILVYGPSLLRHHIDKFFPVCLPLVSQCLMSFDRSFFVQTLCDIGPRGATECIPRLHRV
jgi:hypothetical protein